MISVNQEVCKGCGVCVEICHENCIQMVNGFPTIDDSLCSTCTQCIALCPNQALSWNGQPSLPFSRSDLPTQAQLMELFQERRSIRQFKPDKIARSLLEEIVQAGVYAPFHPGKMRALIVDDPALITTLDQALVNNCRWIYRLAFQIKIGSMLAGWFGFKGEMERARPKLEATLKRGHSFHSLPTAFVIMVGEKKAVLQVETAQFILANMMYSAQLKGVGTCLWGNGSVFVDKQPGLRRALGIRPQEKIYGALYMGYPAIKFKNKVYGKKLPIQWNNSKPPNL